MSKAVELFCKFPVYYRDRKVITRYIWRLPSSSYRDWFDSLLLMESFVIPLGVVPLYTGLSRTAILNAMKRCCFPVYVFESTTFFDDNQIGRKTSFVSVAAVNAWLERRFK